MGMRVPRDIDSAVNNGGTTTATAVSGVGVSASGIAKTGGIPAIAPASNSSSGTAVNGTGVDRLTTMFNSVSLFVACGASTGGPGTQSAVFKIQDSADNVTFADYVPPQLSVAPTVTLTADNTAAQLGVDLSGARQYIRCTYTPTYSTITAQLYCAMFVLGGAVVEPTA